MVHNNKVLRCFYFCFKVPGVTWKLSSITFEMDGGSIKGGIQGIFGTEDAQEKMLSNEIHPDATHLLALPLCNSHKSEAEMLCDNVFQLSTITGCRRGTLTFGTKISSMLRKQQKITASATKANDASCCDAITMATCVRGRDVVDGKNSDGGSGVYTHRRRD